MPIFADEILELVRKHALFNAYRHSGKATDGAVLGKVLAEKPELRDRIKDLERVIHDTVVDINKLSSELQLTALKTSFPEVLDVAERKEKGLPPLPSAERGKVVTRFPPEPNGPLHIGHAKAAIIDEAYARMYEGKFILRYDDTNPANEKKEFYGAIKEALQWLGVRPDVEKNTSDDIEVLYEYALQLIAKGRAYACVCDGETVRRNRNEARECEHRAQSIEKNRAQWERMFSVFKQNEAILRLLVDMSHANTALRDPTLFRIVDAPHPLRGSKYRVWPTYDFSVSIEDHLDGVTHAMRSKEYELRDELYYLMIDLLGLRRPHLIEFSRLELRGAPLSKRKLKPLVESGLVEGWDDPRLPTLFGLRRRGFLPQAIREYVLSLGVSKAESLPTWDLLESYNRRTLDPVARRYYFVKDPIKLVVKDAPELTAKLRLHPEREYGERLIETHGTFFITSEDAQRYSAGDVFRLLELYNVKVEKKEPSKISGRYTGHKLTEDVPKIHWVAEKFVDFEVKVPGPLFTGEVFNEESLSVVGGYAEEACDDLKAGDLVQFVRFGFCRVDAHRLAILSHR